MWGRKLRRLLARAGLAVLLAAGTSALRPRPHRVTRETAARIRLGMHISQVRGILGPPGDYSTGPVLADGSPMVEMGFGRISSDHSSDHNDVWVSDSAQVRLRWDGYGTSYLVVFTPMTRVPQPYLDNLLWRAKRQWHRWFPSRPVRG
jgi:hypothetical protein